MCGRYATTRSAADLSALFDAVDETDLLEPRYNVAPTDPVPVVRTDRSGRRILARARWGLLPHWARDPRQGARMINARAETVATAPAYARLFAAGGNPAGHRALVPADGWYEWRRLPGGGKQAYFITPADGSPLVLAGLWSRWSPAPVPEREAGPRPLDRGLRSATPAGDSDAGHRPLDRGLRSATPAGGRVLTFTVLTTAAVGELAAVHDRMPLLLPPDRWTRWLSGDPGLDPPPPAFLAGLELRPVGPAVGNVRNDGPELVTRVDIDRVTDRSAPTLF